MATHLPVQTVLISTMKSISIVYKHSFSAKSTTTTVKAWHTDEATPSGTTFRMYVYKHNIT